MFENAPAGFAPMTYKTFDVREATDINLNPGAAMLHIVGVTPGVRVIILRGCGAWMEDGTSVENKIFREMAEHCNVDMIVAAGWPTDPDVVDRTKAFLLSIHDESFWHGRIMDNPVSNVSRANFDDRIYRAQETLSASRAVLPVKYTGHNRVFGSAAQEVQHVFDDLARKGFYKYLLIPQNAVYVYGESPSIKYVEPWTPDTMPISEVAFTRNGTLRGIMLDGHGSRIDISPYAQLASVVRERKQEMVGAKLNVLRTIMPRCLSQPYILGLAE